MKRHYFNLEYINGIIYKSKNIVTCSEVFAHLDNIYPSKENAFLFYKRMKGYLRVKMKKFDKKTNKGTIITLVVSVLGLSIGGYAFFGGFSVFNFNFNISMQENQVQHKGDTDTNTIEDTNDKITTTVAKKSDNEEKLQKTISSEKTNLSFKDYIGKWKLHLYSYNARKLYSVIEIKNVNENSKTIDLIYHYSISPVLTGNNTVGQKSITVSYKNEKIKILYPDENEINNVRKEEIYALTTDLFSFEDDELGKIRSCKLAIAEDGNLYANYTENGSYDYEQTICKK